MFSRRSAQNSHVDVFIFIVSETVEGYSGVAAWKSGRKATPKGAAPSTACRSIASRANERLHARYGHLAREKHKNANKAKVAVVSELVRWIWVIGLRVQEEQRGEGAAA